MDLFAYNLRLADADSEWAKEYEPMDAIYMDGKTIARIGDVVMTHGQMRGIVISMEGTFVRVLGIGTDIKTGVTAVLAQRYVEQCPASNCHYLEKQTLSL